MKLCRDESNLLEHAASNVFAAPDTFPHALAARADGESKAVKHPGLPQKFLLHDCVFGKLYQQLTGVAMLD
jgi:hypothetical protein